MKTVTIQIENTGDKLRQAEWASFVMDLGTVIERCCGQIHFCGFSAGDAPWQNHCVVAECDDLDWLQAILGDLATKYRQDSIAMTVGTTVYAS
jgi:hypothetical protein